MIYTSSVMLVFESFVCLSLLVLSYMSSYSNCNNCHVLSHGSQSYWRLMCNSSELVCHILPSTVPTFCRYREASIGRDTSLLLSDIKSKVMIHAMLLLDHNHISDVKSLISKRGLWTKLFIFIEGKHQLGLVMQNRMWINSYLIQSSTTTIVRLLLAEHKNINHITNISPA